MNFSQALKSEDKEDPKRQLIIALKLIDFYRTEILYSGICPKGFCDGVIPRDLLYELGWNFHLEMFDRED